MGPWRGWHGWSGEWRPRGTGGLGRAGPCGGGLETGVGTLRMLCWAGVVWGVEKGGSDVCDEWARVWARRDCG